MDTTHLRSFLKIAELGSITRAAEALGIAQPSLSQQLLRLEDEVGFKLFRRTARGVATTEAGRIFQEHATHILRSIDQALDDMRLLKGEASGLVTLALPNSISRFLTVTLVESVMKHAPLVQLRLVEAYTGHIRSWLEEGKIDLGLLYELEPMRHLSVRRLATEELFLVGPEGRFSAGQHESVPVTELVKFPMILSTPEHGLRQFVELEASKQGFALDVRLEIDALGRIGSLIAKGHGYSILTKPAVAQELESGRLSIARIGEGALKRTLCLARNPARLVTHASVRVEDLAAKVLGRMIVKKDWEAEPDDTLPWAGEGTYLPQLERHAPLRSREGR